VLSSSQKRKLEKAVLAVRGTKWEEVLDARIRGAEKELRVQSLERALSRKAREGEAARSR